MVYTVSLSGICACIKYTTLSLLYAGVGMSSDSGKYATRVTYHYTHALAHTENACSNIGPQCMCVSLFMSWKADVIPCEWYYNLVHNVPFILFHNYCR